MPRKAAAVPNRHIHTTFPPQLADRLELYLYSESEGRVPKAALQAFLVERVSEFFNHRTLDLAPYLRTNPGEVVVSANEHSLFKLINHLKEVTPSVHVPPSE